MKTILVSGILLCLCYLVMQKPSLELCGPVLTMSLDKGCHRSWSLGVDIKTAKIFLVHVDFSSGHEEGNVWAVRLQ